MSAIVTVRDAIIAKMQEVLTDSYFRLTDVRNLDRNNGLYFSKGFGVTFGQGVNAQLENGCVTSWVRFYSVKMSNLLATTDHNIEQKDDIEGGLMEDFVSVIKAFAADPTLGGICAKLDYVVDSGIEQNRIEANRYIEISFDLQVTYIENLEPV